MDEHKQHMIDRMLADAAKGIGPEWPALASPGAESEPPPGPDDDYEPPPPPATPRSP